MILVDTSAWIDFFRGVSPLGDAVDRLLEDNDVAYCGPVVTELRRGIRVAKDRERVMHLLGGCQELAQPDALWDEAGELGAALGKRGVTVKTLDLLIATYALSHDVPVLTRDGDFALMQRAGVPLLLAQ